jgi:hypothetical protein
MQHKSQPSLLVNVSLLQPILFGNRGFACLPAGIKQYFMTQQGQALTGYFVSLALVIQ